jgi:hypothetical protein
MSLARTLRYAEWTRPFWWLAAVPFAALASLYFHVVEWTSTVEERGEGAGYSGPAIYVNWHRHLPFTIVRNGHAHRSMMMLGAPYMMPIGLWCRWMGLRIVYGASGAGGREALAKLADLLARGDSVVLAVDGPAGPAFQVKPGCADLARASGCPLIPVAYRTRRGFSPAGRWDRMLMVVPFDRISVVYGRPMRVAPEDPNDVVRERVSAALFALDAEGS